MGEAKALKSSKASSRPSSRPISRLVLALGLLLLGAVAALRLPISYLPDIAFPELLISLGVPGSPGPEEVTRRWVVPMETALRSLGELEGMAGQVSGDGAWLRVRFDPGVDPEQKAARLDAELARLRRRMNHQIQRGAWIEVWPSSEEGGELVAVVWMQTAVDGQAVEVESRLESLPGVRSVEVYGEHREELRVRLRPQTLMAPEKIREAIHHALAGGYLGRIEVGGIGGRRRSVRLAELASDLGRLPMVSGQARLPLSSLATVEELQIAPLGKAHFEGRQGRALVIRRESDAHALVVDREVASIVEGDERLDFVRRGAEPLRTLLACLALGLLGAIIVGWLASFWLAGLERAWAGALAAPLIVALALNLLWLFGLQLDVTTLLALALGVAAGLVWVLLCATGSRGKPAAWVGAALSMAALPITVALVGGRLGPLLARPALTFLLAGLASFPVVFLLGPSRRALPRASVGRALRVLLRDPLTVLLVFVTFAALSFGILGPFFEPRSGSLEPRPEELTVRVTLAEGATLESAEKEIEAAEEALGRMPPVLSTWSFFDRRGGVVVAELDGKDDELSRRQAMVLQLRYTLPRGGASIEVGLGGGGLSKGRELRFDAGLESRPEADKEGREIRIVLRSTDLEDLERAWQRVRERLERPPKIVPVGNLRPAWGAPAIRVELERRAQTLPSQVQGLAARLRERSSPPQRRSLPGGWQRSLVVAAADQPVTENLPEVPSRRQLLDRPLRVADSVVVPASLVTAVERPMFPELARQSGRFVLPVDIRCTTTSKKICLDRMKRMQQALPALALPASVDLELPETSVFRWWKKKWRMLLLAVVLPLYLLVVAIARLDSLLLALATLGAPVAGLAAAAPGVASKGWLDEMSLLALAAALAGSFALAMEGVAAASRGSDGGGPGIYRVLAARSPWLAHGMLAVITLLALPVLAAGPESAWRGALQVAVLAFFGSSLAAVAVLPALVQVAVTWRDRDPEHEARTSRPLAWRSPGPPVLAVRNLNKIYPSGFRGLQSASFELETGIVGLLGPNGAGKTTLLRVITGLLEPTRGQVLYRGVAISDRNLSEYRRHIGFLPQDFNAYPGFSAREFLEYWALEKEIDEAGERERQIGELLDLVRLTEHADRKVRDFSGGMRRRMGIAQALLGNPPLLVIDEPTTGLDIEARQRLRRALLAVAKERVVLFSTHIASDVEAVATRILILLRGRLCFDGSVAELLARAQGRVFEAVVQEDEVRGLGKRFRVTSRVRVREGIRIRGVVRPGEEAMGSLATPSLEEAYLAETDLWAGERGGADQWAFLDGEMVRPGKGEAGGA